MKNTGKAKKKKEIGCGNNRNNKIHKKHTSKWRNKIPSKEKNKLKKRNQTLQAKDMKIRKLHKKIRKDSL